MMKASFALTLFLSMSVLGQSEIVTDSKGRKVILKSDNTWELFQASPPNKPAASIKKDEIDVAAPSDIAKILNAAGDSLKKSEFETESEYRKRLSAYAATTINPSTGIPLDKTVFAFSGLATYNAESQEYRFSPSLIKYQSIIEKTPPEIIFVSGRTYGSWDRVLLLPTPRFKMTPAKAQEIKPHLFLLVWGMPVEVSSYSLSVLPTKVAAYNSATGEIYAQADLDPANINKLILQ